ncbi:MAG TPA: translation initiation factor IF-2 subunit beta [Euryarchaeota archaeon]|nr:MAG: translation initiation factor IF-2 subunit beta [Thermoplasmatales archaeon ex4484_6]RLF68619.1 MAG: translation initiation factor IF-2 subunit beta [Thermoplasmata archaeon]HHD15307.1 translation initiation factor IF-2 subunit beta [Euryarchaeota archaeon]
MADEFDYEALLKRAHESMPEEGLTGEERWSVPELDIIYEGRTTVWRNFQEVVDAIRRDAEHIQGHILRSLGSAGSREGRRLILKSQIPAEKLKEKVNEYVNTFVICGECGKPDTHLIKEGRINVIECMACGAKRPVKVKKGLQAKERRKVVIPGDEIDVLIQDVGRMGDGVAKIDKYIIYVPGVAKGAAVRIKVEKVSGTIVIGRVINN